MEEKVRNLIYFDENWYHGVKLSIFRENRALKFEHLFEESAMIPMLSMRDMLDELEENNKITGYSSFNDIIIFFASRYIMLIDNAQFDEKVSSKFLITNLENKYEQTLKELSMFYSNVTYSDILASEKRKYYEKFKELCKIAIKMLKNEIPVDIDSFIDFYDIFHAIHEPIKSSDYDELVSQLIKKYSK